jgi:hypothetical protein
MEKKADIPLPKDYSYAATLEQLDNSELRAKIMVDIFKELKRRHKKNPDKCPWCNN